MGWALLLKLLALAFAGYESAKARYLPGIGALVSVGYLTIARMASLLPPYPAMPLRDSLLETWWLYSAIALALSAGPALFAQRAARDLRDEDDRRPALLRVSRAFLLNVVVDVVILVLVALTDDR